MWHNSDMGTNYERGIIKQVEELTLENERLICENSCLREENKVLRAKITTIESAMAEAITKLTTEIDRLKAQINKNSGNSSKPPSQDGFRQMPNSREPSGRKSGGQPGRMASRQTWPPGRIAIWQWRGRVNEGAGFNATECADQPGHAGKRLELPKNLDELISAGLARREIKDHTDGSENYVTRYTIDVETTLVVTEHRYYKGSAPLGAEVTYGDMLKSLAALLTVEEF